MKAKKEKSMLETDGHRALKDNKDEEKIYNCDHVWVKYHNPPLRLIVCEKCGLVKL